MSEDNGNVFDFLNNRILTHYDAAQKIRRREMPAPRTAIVYPTYVCNQDCLWCEYRSENTEHHSIMTRDQLMGLIADLDALGVKGVEFCGGGEPSLHLNLAEAVRDLHARGMSVGILTNGTKMKGELAEAFVDCGSYVRVGVDGGTPETIDFVKQPKSPEARWEAVAENVAEMIRLRNERGTKCRISLKFVIDQNNRHEIDEAAALARELAVDSIQYKAARLVDSELTPEQSLEVNAEIDRCRDAYADSVVIIGSTTKVNATSQCWLTPLQLTVDTLGEVYLCCYYTHRKDKHTIGNCFDSALNDLWYSQAHWDKIDGIEPKECNNLDCRFVRYNAIMDELVANDSAQFEFI